MVLARIATEVAKRVVTHGTRFVRSDKVAWNKLYSGFPRYVKKGTREGFLVGSTVGGLLSGFTQNDINDGLTDTGNGVPSKIKSKPYQQRKAYSGYGRRSSVQRFKQQCRCYDRKRPKRYF